MYVSFDGGVSDGWALFIALPSLSHRLPLGWSGAHLPRAREGGVFGSCVSGVALLMIGVELSGVPCSRPASFLLLACFLPRTGFNLLEYGSDNTASSLTTETGVSLSLMSSAR